MKEEKSLRKRNSLKGSVLFTVVAVMMVMIVFVMATLTIAGAANKRAYASYSKNQTTYTAKSVLDATIQAMCSDSSIANTVASGSGVPLDVTLPDASMGTATVTATKVGTTSQLNTQTGALEDKDVILLSATSILGEETSTVTNYFLVNPVETPDVPSGINKALTVLGDITNGDGINAFGGASVGISKDSNRWSNQSARQYNIISNNNPRPATGNFAINGSYKNSSSATGAYQLSNGQGYTIFGDFLTGQPLSLESVVNVSTVSSYDELPYIYVEREFQAVNIPGGLGSKDCPIIVYCGGNIDFDTEAKSTKLYSDVYVYNYDFSLINADYSDFDENDTSKYFASNMFDINASSSNMNVDYIPQSPNQYGVSKVGNQNATELLQWAASVVNGTYGTSMGGNFYTKGSLVLKVSQIHGDCYVGNDLEINGDTTIDGVLTVENDVYINNVTMTVDYLDIDPAKLRVNGNPTINGIKYNEAIGSSALEKNKNFKDLINNATTTYVYNNVGTGGDYTIDTELDGITPKYQKVADGKGDYAEDYVLDNDNGVWVYCQNPWWPYGDQDWYNLGKKGTSTWSPFDAYDHYKKDKVYVGDGNGNYKLKYKAVAAGTGDYSRTEIPGSDPLLYTEFPSNRTLTDVLNFVDTPQDILDEYTEQNASGDTVYKTSDYPTTNPNVTTTVYTSDFNTKEVRLNGTRIQTAGEAGYYDTNYNSYNYINSDCTLSGGFGGTKILFNPGSGTLWVELDNITNGNGSIEWVVDDSQGGTVNFFISDNTTTSLQNAFIWTKAYKEAINNGSYTINFYKTTIDANGDEVLDLDASGNPQVDHTETYSNLTLYGNMPKFSDFSKYIPGINVYSGENNAMFNFTNNTFLTGYILAPYLTGSMSTGGTNLSIDYADNIDYSLAHFTNVSTQVVGAVVIGHNFTTNNAGTFVFIAKDSTGSTGNNITIANGDTIMMYSSTYQNS